MLNQAEFSDQILADSPAGVISPDRIFDLLRERGKIATKHNVQGEVANGQLAR